MSFYRLSDLAFFSLSFLKELIVTMTQTIYPQLSSFPAPMPPLVLCSTILGQNFIKRKNTGSNQVREWRKKSSHVSLVVVIFSLLIKTCRDSLCPRFWRMNLTSWAPQVVVGWGRIGCEDLREDFGSRTSFCSVAKWSNIPLVPWTCPWNLYLGKTAFDLGRTQVLCLWELSF